MKKMKKVALVLCAALAVSMMAGCGFDASAYVKATLDNSYKNDPSGYVAQKVATEEEAKALHDQLIDQEVSSVTMAATQAGATLSDDTEAAFKQLFEDLYAAADYTVGESKSVGSGAFEVTVEYKQLNVFKVAYENYQAATADIDTTKYESTDDLYNDMFMMLVDCIRTELDKADYGETQTMTIKVSPVNKVYTPDQNDLQKLGEGLFDLN